MSLVNLVIVGTVNASNRIRGKPFKDSRAWRIFFGILWGGTSEEWTPEGWRYLQIQKGSKLSVSSRSFRPSSLKPRLAEEPQCHHTGIEPVPEIKRESPEHMIHVDQHSGDESPAENHTNFQGRQ